MTRFADASRCPDCSSLIPPQPMRCPSCGLLLAGPIAASLFETLRAADNLLAQLRVAQPIPASAAIAGPGPVLAAPPAGPAVRVGPAHPPPPPARGLSGASVPKILLSLGALCLLIAASVFLAVAWAWLGMSGRTLVLAGMTAAVAAAARWSFARGLRAGAEALSTVALVLLELDLLGAASAGWLGWLSDSGQLVLSGAVIGIAALAAAWRTLPRALVVPQLVAPVAAWQILAGLSDLLDLPATTLALACAALLFLAFRALVAGLRVLPWTAVTGAALAWVPLVTIGLGRMSEDPTSIGLWVHGHGWPTLAAAALLAGPAAVVPDRWPSLRTALGGAAALLVSMTAVFPVFDESGSAMLTVMMLVAAAWAVVCVMALAQWRHAAAVPMLAAGLGAAALLSQLSAAIVNRLGLLDRVWLGDLTTRLPAGHYDTHPLLLVPGVASLLLVGFVAARLTGTQVSTSHLTLGSGLALGGAALLTLSAFAVPAALLAAVTLAVAIAAGVVATRLQERAGLAVAAAAALGSAASYAALAAPSVTAVTLAGLVALGGFMWSRAHSRLVRGAGAVFVPLAGAGLIWTLGELGDLPVAWRALPVLIVLGALSAWRAEPALEVPSWMAGAVAAAGSLVATFDGGDPRLPTLLAVLLTVAGAFVVGSSLVNPTRRMLAWPGGLMLASATWVRLLDTHVHTPEAYTLPTALVLVAVGLWRLMRATGVPSRDSSSWRFVGPGLTLATAPSLLRLMVTDPVSLRALLLGAACMGLVLAGLRLRLSAPLLVGSVMGGLLVLIESAPYAALLPPWLLIAAAGTVLTVVGITWESRLGDLRRGTSYVAHLR